METMYIISFANCSGAIERYKILETFISNFSKTTHEIFKRIFTVDLRDEGVSISPEILGGSIFKQNKYEPLLFNKIKSLFTFWKIYSSK